MRRKPSVLKKLLVGLVEDICRTVLLQEMDGTDQVQLVSLIFVKNVPPAILGTTINLLKVTA